MWSCQVLWISSQRCTVPQGACPASNSGLRSKQEVGHAKEPWVALAGDSRKPVNQPVGYRTDVSTWLSRLAARKQQTVTGALVGANSLANSWRRYTSQASLHKCQGCIQQPPNQPCLCPSQPSQQHLKHNRLECRTRGLCSAPTHPAAAGAVRPAMGVTKTM